jgi:hypothetical protein
VAHVAGFDPRGPERSGKTGFSHSDLERYETVPGRPPGDRFGRMVRHTGLTRMRRGHLVARREADELTTPLGRALVHLRRLLIGRRLATAQEARMTADRS